MNLCFNFVLPYFSTPVLQNAISISNLRRKAHCKEASSKAQLRKNKKDIGLFYHRFICQNSFDSQKMKFFQNENERGHHAANTQLVNN